MAEGRKLDPVNPPRASRLTAEVCLTCGSLTPTRPDPFCSHGSTAALVELTPAIADLVGRIRRARHGMTAALATLGELVDAERLRGRAVLREPDVEAMPENVVFLRPRDELVQNPYTTTEASEPARSPSSAAPSVPPLVLEVERPQPKPRRSPPASTPRRVPEPPSTPPLFDPKG